MSWLKFPTWTSISKNARNIFSFKDQKTIKVNGRSLNLFFASGCGDMVIKKSAIDYLQKLARANLEMSGQIEFTGVDEQKSTCKHGAYSIRLPLKMSVKLY